MHQRRDASVTLKVLTNFQAAEVAEGFTGAVVASLLGAKMDDRAANKHMLPTNVQYPAIIAIG